MQVKHAGQLADEIPVGSAQQVRLELAVTIQGNGRTFVRRLDSGIVRVDGSGRILGVDKWVESAEWRSIVKFPPGVHPRTPGLTTAQRKTAHRTWGAILSKETQLLRNILDEGAAIVGKGVFRIETPGLDAAARLKAFEYFRSVVTVDNKFLRKHLLQKLGGNEAAFKVAIERIRAGLGDVVRFE